MVIFGATIIILGYIFVILVSVYGIYIGYQILLKHNNRLPKIIHYVLWINTIIWGKERMKKREKELSTKKSLTIIGIISIITCPISLLIGINMLITFLEFLVNPR